MWAQHASFNGYSFAVDHNGNSMRIDRRTGGAATAIGTSVSFNPPEDSWYRIQMTKSGSQLTLAAFDEGGTHDAGFTPNIANRAAAGR